MDIVVATSNKNKLLELRSIGEEFGHRLLSPEEAMLALKLDTPPDVDETADTFEGNARLKAEAFFNWSGLPSLGDDSGLEVEALDNRPGVFSARYAGVGASDQQKIEKLLKEVQAALERNPALTRRAQFRCALALVLRPDNVLESQGKMGGEIVAVPRGEKGFGYDPVVLLDDFGATLAEIDFELTCKQGFRALAAKKLFQKLKSA